MPQIYAFMCESPTIPCIFDGNTPFATSTAQPNSPSHAAAEAVAVRYHGDAIRMKTTAASPTAA